MIENEIVLDTKIISPFYLHKLIKEGGSIKFNNYPFGIRLVGNEQKQRVEMRLFAIPSGVVYTAHMNPHKKKEPEPDIEIEEGEMEMM